MAGGAPGDTRVEVVGLAEFQRELRALGTGLQRDLTKANKEAADFIAQQAKGRASGMGGVHAKSAPALAAAGQQRNAIVRIDAGRHPYALGAEFGAKQYPQFPRWRGNQWNPDAGGVGYFLHPTIRDTKQEFIELYGDLLDALAARAFPE